MTPEVRNKKYESEFNETKTPLQGLGAGTPLGEGDRTSRTNYVLIALVFLLTSFIAWEKPKPVLYIIGDSTVKKSGGNDPDGLYGWGSFMDRFVDTLRMQVENHAIGGRSSRTFITEGRWDVIMERLKPGDYVMMQFGHNDAGALDDTARARGSIKGLGEESKEIYNPIRKVNEVVYTYGHYIRKYVNDAKSKGAIPIICSPVPRENFVNGKVVRNDNYAVWSKDIADQTGAYFIPLNTMICDKYDALGADSVKKFFPIDHTHPNYDGSMLSATLVTKGIKDLKKCKLKKFVK